MAPKHNKNLKKPHEDLLNRIQKHFLKYTLDSSQECKDNSVLEIHSYKLLIIS